MKLNFIVVLVFSFIFLAMGVGYKIRKMEKCAGNNKHISVEKCFVIDETLLNLKINVIVGLDYSLFKLSVFKKNNDGEFKELFKNLPALNWCKVMDGTSKYASNFLMKIVMVLYKTKFPEFFQRCPFGPMVVEKINMTIENKLIVMMPTGLYRITFTFKYKNGEMMFDQSFLIEIL
ncbi:unnamed protein product [Chironomus riparius]|uniref:Uncharacterized protein n=1 Tax=Chironomus riparius TaxID=315576 RepID=A0A9N9RZ84_9DIPT|nr:unnamed protein product [Chironomus riparius]